MSEWLTRVINENPAQCRAEGIAEGFAQGIAKAKAQAIAEGFAEGFSEGTLETLTLLVHEGLISVKDAARVATMSRSAFCEKTGLSVPGNPDSPCCRWLFQV